MFRALLIVVGVIVAALIVIGIVFVVGMRTKRPFVLDAVRRMNKAVFNPAQLRKGGRPGSYAIIRHVGRSSGRGYETPVQVRADGEDYVVALPYGDRADWVRNVLAAGSATVTSEGYTQDVTGPELVDIDTVEVYDEAERRSHRRFGVDQALRMRGVGESTPFPVPPSSVNSGP